MRLLLLAIAITEYEHFILLNKKMLNDCNSLQREKS